MSNRSLEDRSVAPTSLELQIERDEKPHDVRREFLSNLSPVLARHGFDISVQDENVLSWTRRSVSAKNLALRGVLRGGLKKQTYTVTTEFDGIEQGTEVLVHGRVPNKKAAREIRTFLGAN